MLSGANCAKTVPYQEENISTWLRSLGLNGSENSHAAVDASTIAETIMIITMMQFKLLYFEDVFF